MSSFVSECYKHGCDDMTQIRTPKSKVHAGIAVNNILQLRGPLKVYTTAAIRLSNSIHILLLTSPIHCFLPL